jgi:ABC-2 type transport system ATP-binding protein
LRNDSSKKFAIEIGGLTKRFNSFAAVNNISFRVEYGELFGLLGPNGAGKTTAVKMLATLLKPTSGWAKVAGFDVKHSQDEVRNNIGIVFQEPALDNKLTGKENLDFHSRMYGISKTARNRKIAEVLELVELEDSADMLVEKYSGGMKRRLEIARGLIHEPKVLFLDEPTLGLDAQTRRHIWDYIERLSREKKITIIITTHYMEEADYLCGRVGIIDKGKIVVIDAPQNLKNLIGADVIRIELEEPCEEKVFRGLDFVRKVKSHDCFIDLGVKQGEQKIPAVVEFAGKNKIKIKSISISKPSLEDVFLHFTGETIREKEASQGEISRERIRRRMGRR